MDYISTTDLRSKTARLVDTLRKGGEVVLVHRSKVIGRIKPTDKESITFDFASFQKLAGRLKLPTLTYKQIKSRYSAYLKKKYGKNLS